MGRAGNACYAYGVAPGKNSATIDFAGGRREVNVSSSGVWAFITVCDDLDDVHDCGFSSLKP